MMSFTYSKFMILTVSKSVIRVIIFFLLSSDFQTRCPMGKRTILFKRAKQDNFAEYLCKDGLVMKLSSYADYECE